MAKRMLDRMLKKGVKTCPASRHAHDIVEAMRSKDGMGRLLNDAGFDPDSMADSIEAVIVSLWTARQHLEWRPLPKKVSQKGEITFSGRWVPITSPSGEPK